MSEIEETRAKASEEEQPFHEAGAELPAAEPEVPNISDAATRAREHARGVNFRDLHTASAAIQAGRVYRSSQVVSAADLDTLGIAAVLDLRQPPVNCKTHSANIRRSLKQNILRCMGLLSGQLSGRHLEARHSRGSAANHDDNAVEPQPCMRCTADCCERYGIPARVYHVDMLPTRVSLRILRELPRGIQARVLWAAAQRKHPEPIVAGAVADPQVMGYLKLYTILLEKAKPRLATAMRLFADAANYPLLVHCIHGKDRTGLAAMLLLLLCGVERQAVVRDYALSEALLQEGREKRQLLGLPEHLTTNQIMAAAAAVMESTIDHLEGCYGSAYNYLKQLGLTEGELAAIVRHLTQPGLVFPTAAEQQAQCTGAS